MCPTLALASAAARDHFEPNKRQLTRTLHVRSKIQEEEEEEEDWAKTFQEATAFLFYIKAPISVQRPEIIREQPLLFSLRPASFQIWKQAL